MKYKNQINPELRQIARNIPYNEMIIKCANIFLMISFHLTAVPKQVVHKTITIRGHQGLKVPVDIFEPSNGTEKLPCLIYVHGGAFSYRASAYHKKLACIYAKEAGCRVYFPDYHLTPKYPYPAAYEDVLALYKCIMGPSEALEMRRKKIGVAGDSAGASIAALICHHYEKEHLQQPCLQMLVYPLTDITMQTDSMKKFTNTPLWNAKNNKRMWFYYGRNSKSKDLYSASPMHSSLPQSIPDAYIETAEYDCLHDEGVLYGEKLRKAGANVEINDTRGTIHGYDSAINTQIAIDNIAKRVSFLKRGFHDGSSI